MASRVTLLCDRCRRSYEPTAEDLAAMRNSKAIAAICGRPDCEQLAQELERHAQTGIAATTKKKRAAFPPAGLQKVEIPERDIQQTILHYLRVRQVFAWRQNQGAMRIDDTNNPNVFRRRKKRLIKFAHVDGISDIIGVYKGRFLAIEVKRVGKHATDDQRDFLKRVDEEGGIAILAYSVDDVVTALDDVDKGKR